MATRYAEFLFQTLPMLCFEPTTKWIRAWHHGRLVLDTRGAALLWEPLRVTPVYAVPEGDVLAVLRDSATSARTPSHPGPLSPDDPFIEHTAEGTVLDVVVDGEVVEAAAFRFADPDLAGMIEFDFLAFQWREEEEPIVAHPRDPFKRVDFRASTRHVKVELDGVLLAESNHPTLVFETHIPERYYLPPEDVKWEALEATDSMSMCPYKGTARYWKVPGARKDIAWSYAEPVSDATQLAGLVCFYNERIDLSVDGVPQPRPKTLFE